MISSEQKEWLAHLNDSNKVTIIPYDPEAPKKFEEAKKKILKILPKDALVLHRGASSMGISGQGELDIYIPVEPEGFDTTVRLLEEVFGKPGSLYPLKRARFNLFEEETKVELFVINKEDRGWTESCIFEDYLRRHPETLVAYRELKERSAGTSTREYYTRKIEFINGVLAKVQELS